MKKNTSHFHHNPQYLHHKNPGIASTMRELVFGMEDGMVSTFGSVTGIALATQDPYVTILAGGVIVGVESISMAVGSYISSKSKQSIDERMLEEEKEELERYPKEEEQELEMMYRRDGWSKTLSTMMAEEASKNKKLFLHEMALRELRVFPDSEAGENPLRNGVVMGGAYVFGGIIPLLGYFIFPVQTAVWWSVGITLFALFLLGVGVSKVAKRPWLRTAGELVVLASIAGAVGFVIGQFVEQLY